MKQFLFLTTHLGSGSMPLFFALESYPRIKMNQTNTDYDHPSVVYDFFNPPTSGTIYGEQLLFNFSLSHKKFLEFSKFIYFIRSGRHTINELVKNKNFSISNCLLYYSYRMRRICEMARMTPGAILLTWDNLKDGKGMDLIKDYVGMKYKADISKEKFKYSNSSSNIDYRILQKADECYERHYYYLRQLNLKMIN